VQQPVEAQPIGIERIGGQFTGQLAKLLLNGLGTRTSKMRSIRASIENRWALMFSKSARAWAMAS